MLQDQETICALSTPPGIGGLAVVRITGDKSLSMADKVFKSPGGKLPSSVPSHTVHYGRVVCEDGKVIDEVMLTVLKAPRTFTGEDVVEISGHGGPVASRLILERLFEVGARLAGPGEFTRRAFLNGRLDLTQAEAVADLIHARTDKAVHVAALQLKGVLGKDISRLRDDLMGVLAHIEAHIDFPDEDIRPETSRDLEERCQKALEIVRKLIASAREGRVMREGIQTVITGSPNVGKSSLFNALVGHDRAIVTSVPGTTRDTLEEVINMGGLPLVLTDTAGIRETGDLIEAEGVRRSHQARDAAELVLHVCDATVPGESTGEMTDPRVITIYNKCDLLNVWPEDRPGVIYLSAMNRRGFDRLEREVWRKVGLVPGRGAEGGVPVNARHQEALIRCAERLVLALDAMVARQSLEFVALDLRGACEALGEVVGLTGGEDLLDRIFSTFCIGK